MNLTNRELIENYAFNIGHAFTISGVAGVLGITYDSAKYHVRQLHKKGKIKLAREWRQQKEYVWHSVIKDEHPPVQEIIYQAIERHPGICQSELIRETGLGRSTVERWLRVFRAEEVVETERRNHNAIIYKPLVERLPEFSPIKTYGVRYAADSKTA